MGRSTVKIHDQRGWTLVELLVVIAIISVVASLALMQRGNTNEVFKSHNVAYGLKNAFERARFDSVKRRPTETGTDLSAYVSVANTAFTMATDRNSDGALVTADNITTNFSAENITIQYLTGPSAVNMPAKITFNQRGEPTSKNSLGADVAPAFLICNGTCAGGRTAANSNIVLVTASGTVNLLPGDAGVPAFNIPPVSTIPGTDVINDLISFLGAPPAPIPVVTPSPGPTGTPGPSPTGTPVPTATPTPDPTVTPTPDPSVTPTGTPTATPTATPSVTPTPTPTPTPVPCTISVSSPAPYTNGTTHTIQVNYSNSTGGAITNTLSGGQNNWQISSLTPKTVYTVTPSTSSGFYTITFQHSNSKNSANGSGTITISGCGSGGSISLTVNLP
jgi:prepilin-type N-terminal cleavage/methylation domain-containing protein